MPSVTESIGKTPLAAALEAGLDTLDLSQTVTFTKYLKLVLPLDGYVFWIRADLVAPTALFNAAQFNAVFYNQPPEPLSGPITFQAKGSMHFSTTTVQEADEAYALNRMVFTATEPVDDMNDISPQVVYIGEHEGVRFSFSQRGKFYRQADLYHYIGDSLYPIMESQVIDDIRVLDTRNVIVSNSLPAWLTLNRFMPLYPGFLVPDNLPPPYGIINIDPQGTRALQPVPTIGPTGTHAQLVADRVKITMYGLRNFEALDFVDYVNQYSLDTDVLGIMNMPVIRDEQRNQNELGIIAQKKTIEYEVSYYQLRLREVSRQFILSCIPSFDVEDVPAVPMVG